MILLFTFSIYDNLPYKVVITQWTIADYAEYITLCTQENKQQIYVELTAFFVIDLVNRNS